MRYDVSKKLSGAPAAYYLTPKGLRELQRGLPYITDAVIKNAYGDKNASESLIRESVEIFEVSHALLNTYPDMKVLTPRQIGDIEYFPRPLPNLYLAHKKGEGTFRFFLYQLRDVKRYDVAIHATIARIIAYRESGVYDESGNEFPVVLFVCQTAAIERHAQRSMRNARNRSSESILVYTTSYQAVVTIQKPDQVMWSSIDDPDTLVRFKDIEA
jgi:hypothetical protein